MRFDHPNPAAHRLNQRAAALLLIVMVFAGIGQIVLVLLGVPAPLFVITGLLTLALTLPVILLTVQSPAVTVTPEHLTLHSAVWGDQTVEWSSVLAVKPDPLLPPVGAETLRRAAAGRANYRPAEGILVVIKDLPFSYRVVGFFAGEGWRGAVRLGSRTHQQYPRLVELIETYAPKHQLD